MRLQRIAICNHQVPLLALLGIALLILCGGVPAHSQISRSIFNLETKGDNGTTVQAGNREVSIDTTSKIQVDSNQNKFKTSKIFSLLQKFRNNKRFMLGAVVVALMGGTFLYVRFYRRRKATEAEIFTWLTATPEQRDAAAQKVAEMFGTINDVAKSREYLEGLQNLLVYVDDYDGATYAADQIYLFCREIEKEEPALCQLLTDGWFKLVGFQQSVPPLQWDRQETNYFLGLLSVLSFETEALIEKSTQKDNPNQR